MKNDMKNGLTYVQKNVIVNFYDIMIGNSFHNCEIKAFFYDVTNRSLNMLM